MGENIIKARQTAKIATSSEWEDSTLPLKRGELTINETTGEMRFGDGVDTFNNSPKVKTVPLSHSSSSTEYGVGNGENYGHVKLSDSTDSTSDVSDGTAATPAAVKAAYDLANKKADKQTTYGGFMGGNDTYASSGGAVGKSAYSTTGGAVGNEAEVTSGGGAVGESTFSENGGAVGYMAKAKSGGAVGANTQTGDGVAIGKNAKTVSSGNTIDAIQLGTGTNNTAKTMQVYDKRIVEADGTLTDVGDLDTLSTTNKTDIVSAINEIKGDQLIYKVDTFTSNSGSDYVATVEGLTEYKEGMLLIFSPNVTSTTTEPELNINELGFISIARTLTATPYSSYDEYTSDAFRTNRSYLLQYNGSLFVDISRPKVEWADIDKPSSFTPTSHASSATTYGIGTGSNYGHVKLSDSTSSTSGVSGGTAATPSAVKAVYDSLSDKCFKSEYISYTGDILNSTVLDGYMDDGVYMLRKSTDDSCMYLFVSSRYRSYDADENMEFKTIVYSVSQWLLLDNHMYYRSDSVQETVRVEASSQYDEEYMQTLFEWTEDWSLMENTPISHASSATTYGTGTSSNYGHVKLSDSTSSTSGTSGGIAATPAAVKAAYDKANIKKNPDGTTGDIIDTHLTVGTRLEDSDIGSKSFVSGENNEASAGISAVVGGRYNTASGYESVVTGGDYNTASNYNSAVVGGWGNTAGGGYAVILGGSQNNISEESVLAAILGGSVNTASGNNSAVIGGDSNEASGIRSAAVGGNGNTASGTNSASIGGYNNEASAESSVIIGGNYNTALQYQVKTGHYSKAGTAGNSSGTTGDAFIIGNGSSDTSRSNAFRVAYTGSVYALSAFNSTGADYAELLEWEDGNTDNADRRGLFVTWGANDKIKIASAGDEIVGIISATSSVIGNAYEDSWQGMYLTDVFGQPITQTVHHDAEYIDVEVPDTDEDGNILETTHTEQQLLREAYDAEEYAVNPDYDPAQEYIPRSQRREWAKVGMLGQLIVIDDGTCTVGSRCTVGDNGKAVASEEGYRVMERIDETHIKIFFK